MSDQILADAEQQARAALDAYADEHTLPRFAWTHVYDKARPWLSAHVDSVVDALTWAKHLNVEPVAHATIVPEDGDLHSWITVVDSHTIPGVAYPVDIAFHARTKVATS